MSVRFNGRRIKVLEYQPAVRHFEAQGRTLKRQVETLRLEERGDRVRELELENGRLRAENEALVRFQLALKGFLEEQGAVVD